MINTSIPQLARLFFSSFPYQNGKWTLWRIYKNLFSTAQFKKGTYNTNHGFKLNLENERYIEKYIYYWGEWEGNETHFIKEFLPKDGLFIDIGANIGYFSCLAASIVGNKGHVFSFEPVPQSFQLLSKNIHLNNFHNITAYQIAASNKKGSMLLAKPKNPCALEMVTTRNASTTKPHWEIPSERVDEIVDRNQSIDMIKIDIEGAEMLALAGLVEHLSKQNAPIVLCEVNDSFLTDMGSSAEKLMAYMINLGYFNIYRFNKYKLSVFDGATTDYRTLQENIIFSKTPLNEDNPSRH